jgi:hypothetical protein
MVSRMPSLTFSYKQDPEAVFRFLTDPTRAKERAEAMGERDVQVTNDSNTVTSVRVVEAEIPSFAKKIFSPTNTVKDVKRWDATSKKATFQVEIKGAPVTISGDISIKPGTNGSEYKVNFDVQCKIPLLGGQISKHIAKLTEQGLQREWEWNQKMLDASS